MTAGSFAWLQFGTGAGPFCTIGADARRVPSGRWYVARNGADYRQRWYPVRRDGTALIAGERVKVTLFPAGNPTRVTVTNVSEDAP